MSKYQALTNYLANAGFNEIPMTFSEVQKVIGSPLPRSATAHRPWWANEAQGHVHAKAWLSAGYETAQVDMKARKLVFKRIAKRRVIVRKHGDGMSDVAREFKPGETENKMPYRSPLFGAMKGTFTLVPPSGDEPPPENPESWEALNLAKLDRLLFGKGE
jgi:hypothetical protein